MSRPGLARHELHRDRWAGKGAGHGGEAERRREPPLGASGRHSPIASVYVPRAAKRRSRSPAHRAAGGRPNYARGVSRRRSPSPRRSPNRGRPCEYDDQGGYRIQYEDARAQSPAARVELWPVSGRRSVSPRGASPRAVEYRSSSRSSSPRGGQRYSSYEHAEPSPRYRMQSRYAGGGDGWQHDEHLRLENEALKDMLDDTCAALQELSPRASQRRAPARARVTAGYSPRRAAARQREAGRSEPQPAASGTATHKRAATKAGKGGGIFACCGPSGKAERKSPKNAFAKAAAKAQPEQQPPAHVSEE